MFFTCCLFNSAFAQSPQDREAAVGVGEIVPLMVGQKVPDEFWTKEHLFYSNGDTVRRTLEEHKGKMLVLGFWATWCSSCLKNTPYIEAFVQEYIDKLAFVKVNPINTRDSLGKIQDMLHGNIGKGYNLQASNFSSIVDDVYIQSLFPNYGFPYYIWINKGVVQILTYRNLLDKNNNAPFTGRGL